MPTKNDKDKNDKDKNDKDKKDKDKKEKDKKDKDGGVNGEELKTILKWICWMFIN